ncbi:hypothetical protein ACWD4Z_23435 [Streptomyces antibioticus]|uniref:hypothetical protein n=1 Tax=Streptomyces antibioticus TaxID=1890 RepID=UPI0033D58709
MGRERAGDGGAQDVERLLDDLYTTPPPGFVTRRAELALAARSAGNAADARRIRAARRPTLAAWAANLLLRAAPEESRRFLELGEALREAFRTLDAGEVKELSDRRRSVVAALTRQAVALAEQAGQRLSDSARGDVESTLRAVLADREAAERWATGRLEHPLTPPTEFGEETGAPSAGSHARDELADRRRRREAEKRHRLEEARREAAAADRRLRDRRTEQAVSDEELTRARADHDRAAAEVSEAERRLDQARSRLRLAEEERRTAEERQRAAADAVSEAEEHAQSAAREVERLTPPSST